MILVYCTHITPRLAYMADFAGRFLSGSPLQLTTDPDVYRSSPLPRINYSVAPLAEKEIHILPAGLLQETGIRPLAPVCYQHPDGYTAFFETGGSPGFDLLSASFYLVSRYEEYLPHTKDMYGRYAHENALAFREGFLQKPLVNTWFYALRQQLQRLFPHHGFAGPAFRFLPTYDIDMAWSYLHKGLWRNLGGFVQQLLKRQFKEALTRIRVLTGRSKDPYDTFELLDNWHAAGKADPVYFFLLAGQTSRYDKNISPYHFSMRKLIRSLHKKYKTGIHPSWQSGDKPELLKKETAMLATITGSPVKRSRQHFIRMDIPGTYRRLIQEGITEDYSMGYGSINGFRASVAEAYYWYDLEKEETTPLLLYPFCFMDANSYYEQKQSPEETAMELQYYFNSVKEVNGLFSMIWHNPFFGSDPAFAGWREIYQPFLAAAGS